MQRQNFLGIIIKETERLTRLINQILDIQKLESQEMEWHFSRFNFNELIHESVITMQRVFEEKNVQLKIRGTENNYQLKGDKDRLMQVMQNLLSNALKFCPEKNGEVEISISHDPNHVYVEIADNGIGIDEEDQKIIFEKFRQAKVGSNHKRPIGSGLGLSITRKIIEAHGGTIGVKSKPEQGSVFTFNLPYQVAKEKEAQV